jgi:voltage-gated potassium channel
LTNTGRGSRWTVPRCRAFAALLMGHGWRLPRDVFLGNIPRMSRLNETPTASSSADDESSPHTPSQRIYGVLRTWNNLLLIPLVSLMIAEATTDGAPIIDFGSANLVFCMFFGAEWLFGLAIAPNRRAYLKSPLNIVDLVSSIPFGYVFQSARAARLLRMVRLLRVVMRSQRLRGRAGQVFRVAGLLICTTLAGGLALRIVEPSAAVTLSDALWWSLVTITTVGYGDVIPVSAGGRVIAAILMTWGIGVFGYIAGTMTALIQGPDEDEILRTLRALDAKVNELTENLREREAYQRALPDEH